jgi:low temperature requirement protein LtrA
MVALTSGSQNTQEEHRAATPLELMFDLASVIAVSAAASGLHHGISAGHAGPAILQYAAAFFMVWWSWMNYTWFSSAYDDGSWWFRVLSMVAIVGVLTVAAGIATTYQARPLLLALSGFVILRVAMAALWLGAAIGDPPRRRTAIGYASGIIAMQAFWAWMILTVPPTDPRYMGLFLLGAIGEMSVPAICEAAWGKTRWHRGHIAERYGLLNLIVLGECFLSVTSILVVKGDGGLAGAGQVELALGAAIVTFSLWSAYFTRHDQVIGEQLRQSLLWGYSHFVLFAAGAAVGAGFAVRLEALTGRSAIGELSSGLAIAIPISLYLLSLWVMREARNPISWHTVVLPGIASLLPVLPFLVHDPLPLMTLFLVAGVWLRNVQAGKPTA